MSAQVPREAREAVCALAYAAAGANVIMQVSRLPVGRAVALSTVDSGRVDKHPIKRLRTTSAFLAVACSAPGDPVPYNAFDPELQLWVGACLYRGLDDITRLVYGADAARLDVLYEHGKRFGTTLQVPHEMWPADRVAFARYWDDGVAQIAMDDITRAYLRGVAGVTFLGAPLGPAGAPIGWALGPLGRFLAVGFLPQPFRDELGLPWDARRQRAFDAVTRAAAGVTRRLPGPVRRFPFNAYLVDTRRRISAGRAIV